MNETGDHEDDEPGVLVIVALLVAMPLMCGTLLFLIAKGNPAMTSDRSGYGFAGALAGFVIGAVARHRMLRRSS
jgi:hypothetical protein